MRPSFPLSTSSSYFLRIAKGILLISSTDEPTAPESVTHEDFSSFISAAASALSPFDYEIRSTAHQISKERIYALVNSTSDPLTQLATVRTPEELGYVRRLLDAMFETYNTRRREVMALTGMQALEKRVTKGAGGGRESSGTQSTDKGVTQEQAEKVLAGLVKEGWLERSAKGFHTLSPRGLMELRGWLLDTYNDEEEDVDEWQRIKFCEACKEIVTIGQRCKELECNVRLHDICTESFWKSRGNMKCPRCERAWDGKGFVGEKAVTTTEEYLKGKRRSAGAGRKNKAAMEAEEEEEEAEEDGEDGEDGEE